MKRTGATVFLALIGLIVVLRLATEDWSTAVSTNVWDLLPRGLTQEEEVGREILQTHISPVMFGLLEAPPGTSRAALSAASREMRTFLRETESFARIDRVDTDEDMQGRFQEWWTHRFFLRMPAWLAQIRGNDSEPTPETLAALTLDRLEAFFEDPSSFVWEEAVVYDPLLLFIDGVDGLDGQSAVTAARPPETAAFWLQIDGSPFDTTNQARVLAQMESIEGHLEAQGWEGFAWEYTGVVRFAAASREAIEREIRWINIAILLGVLALIFIGLRGIRVALPVILVLLFGIATAVAVTAYLLRPIHILTFVLGSILAGVAVDYVLHLFLGRHSMRALMRPLIIGGLSTAVGFLVFLISSLPLLRQTGLFVGVGLTAALALALCLRAWMGAIAIGKQPIVEESDRIYPVRAANLSARGTFITAALALFAILGLFRMSWNDDLRDLEYPLPALQATDGHIRQALGAGETPAWLITGRDWREARTRLEAVSKSIRVHDLSAFHLGSWIPLPDERQACIEWTDTDGAAFIRSLADEMEERDFDSGAFAPFFADWDAWLARVHDYSAWEDAVAAFAESLTGPMRLLFQIESPGHPAWFALSLSDIPAPPVFEAPGVVNLDQLSRLNRLFGQYRVSAGKAAAAGGCLVVVIVLIAYRTKRGAFVLFVPVAAFQIAFGFLGWFGGDLNLFHLVGGFLGACLALDYALFALHARERHAAFPASIHFSAATSGIAFGILSLSRINAVQSLGLTVLLLVLTAWILSYTLWKLTGKVQCA